jgi:hypothetical protein
LKKELYSSLIKLLQQQSVSTELQKNGLLTSAKDEKVLFSIIGEQLDTEVTRPAIDIDRLLIAPEKVVAVILSQLKLNKTVYARNCRVDRIEKALANTFLDKYHLFNSTQSGFNYGLFLNKELIAVASFSKGRKMNRLAEDQRSFELIRFCCISGVTVTGGLSKLIKTFCEEKKAGDVMTYVDKHLSDGTSFMRAGFKKHSETEPNYFLVNRTTFERTSASEDEVFDKEKFYLSKNGGSIKLVYTPASKIK